MTKKNKVVTKGKKVVLVRPDQQDYTLREKKGRRDTPVRLPAPMRISPKFPKLV